MFNWLRVPRPCYRVIRFGPSNTIEQVLTISEISQMQVSTMYSEGFVENYDPARSSYPNEGWVDVPLEGWKAQDEECKVESIQKK